MHNAAMFTDITSTDITIEDLPTKTIDELAARAARRGLSLQKFLRTARIDLASKPDGNDLLARINARKRAFGSNLTVDVILNHRSAERH